MELVTPDEIDVLFCWPAGKSERLARRGVLPHVVLPDGKTIRFNRIEIESRIQRVPANAVGSRAVEPSVA